MAQECNDSSSVAISSSTQQNWWDLHHGNSVSSWTTNNNTSPWQQTNPSSNSSCDDDISMSASFTNASNHSGLTVESASHHRHVDTTTNDLMGDHVPDHTQLWSHLLLGIGSNGDLHNSQEIGENSLDTLSSKSLSSGILLEPTCDDYLKKTNPNWEFTNTSSVPLNNFTDTLFENERVTKLSNLVNNWSIAPPDQALHPLTCSISLSSSSSAGTGNNDHYFPSTNQPQTYSTDSISGSSSGILANRDHNSHGFLTCYGNDHGVKLENENREIEAAGHVYRRSLNGLGFGHHLGLNNSSLIMGDDNININGKYNYYGGGVGDASICERNFRDVLRSNSRFSNKPLADVQVPKPSYKSLNLSACRKQGLHTSSSIGSRGQGSTSEGKKKRSEDTSETTVLKKPKHDQNSTASSVKVQTPKVKITDRITALQQIVSPFGKTDTASVLYEAIQYIKFLQEQVQLLISNPYTKTNSHKEGWGGGFDRKEKGDVKVDLRSRGLCLVPISCTPQVYHDTTGTDYWTPTYRGCLYR